MWDIIGSLLGLPGKIAPKYGYLRIGRIPTNTGWRAYNLRPIIVRDIEISFPLGYIESCQCSPTELSLV